MSNNGIQYDVTAIFQIPGLFLSSGLTFLRLTQNNLFPDRTQDLWPGSQVEVTAPGYAPISIPPNALTLGSDSTGYYFLAGPYSFNFTGSAGETVYGWAITFKPGTTTPTFNAYGGLLPSPFVIPSAGGTLTLGTIRLDQHDCGISPPPPPPPLPYSRDSFAGTTGMPLSATTPDVGPLWVPSPPDPELVIGSSDCVAPAAVVAADIMNVGTTDYIVRVTYTHQANTVPSVIFRNVGVNLYWRIANPGGAWQLIVNNGGGESLITSGAQTLTAGSTYTLILIIQGPSVTLLVNGLELVTYATMTTNLTGVNVGLIILPAGAALPTGSFSNWAVDAVIPIP